MGVSKIKEKVVTWEGRGQKKFGEVIYGWPLTPVHHWSSALYSRSSIAFLAFPSFRLCINPRITDTQWRHKSKKSEILGRCGRQNMLRPYLKIWDWDLIFGCAVKVISSPGVRSPWVNLSIKNGSFAKLLSFFCLSFSGERKIWGNERIYFPENPDLCLISVGTPPNLHV